MSPILEIARFEIEQRRLYFGGGLLLGLLPLALGIGEGSDAQAPLARAVIGGLTASTLITLVLIPAVYSLFHSDP